MKRMLIFMVACLTCIVLCACEEETIIEGSSRYGKEYRIDQVQHTIEYDHNNYSYELGGSCIIITTPLGDTKSYTYTSNMMVGSGDDEFPTMEVADVIRVEVMQKEENDSSGTRVIIGFIMIGVGLINALAPGVVWELKEGWQYRNAEPSDMALILIRLGGIVLIGLGIIEMFVDIFE